MLPRNEEMDDFISEKLSQRARMTNDIERTLKSLRTFLPIKGSLGLLSEDTDVGDED